MKKSRPCIIISPDELNNNIKTVLIAPITSTLREYPTRVELKLNNGVCYVVLDQIRVIDKKRLIKYIDHATNKTQGHIKTVLHEIFA